MRVDTIPPSTPTNLQELTIGVEVARVFTWARSVDPGFPNTGSGVDFYNVEITGPQTIAVTADDSAIVCPGNLCRFTTPPLDRGFYTINLRAADRPTLEALSATADFGAGVVAGVGNLRVVDSFSNATVNTVSPKFSWNPPLELPRPLGSRR